MDTGAALRWSPEAVVCIGNRDGLVDQTQVMQGRNFLHEIGANPHSLHALSCPENNADPDEVGHLITVNRAADGVSVLAQVSLFNWRPIASASRQTSPVRRRSCVEDTYSLFRGRRSWGSDHDPETITPIHDRLPDDSDS